ncbi:ferritin-like domain-containing protein [Tissierella sp. Yu-01]|uniref:ferritin-like domain-containing protein n=1 Tax=Tissierella sp. Yu-01 TaxID=3035694 RepID=UPI00240D9F29|nr:ferritin-like domain-containing protein [Tissierella sp. Yu-01]WFA08264.1 ferritin-like domain-containing protein [Tissierella sp. Yu-01]
MSHYHEPVEKLNEEAFNISRALNSLKEEIEAVDWYNQRVVASKDPELEAILAHNRDEEIEHAVMLIEWLRRNMDGWDHELRNFLFTDGPITGLHDHEEEGSENKSGLNIGNLK